MKRIIVKIGTGVLTDKTGKLDEEVIHGIVDELCGLLNANKEILIVSSGSIGAGMWLLNLKRRPSDLAELQSMASIGQTRLMDTYNKYFNKKGYLTGQILLTQDDFDNRRRYLNIKYTINTLLKHRAIPIINENDTISTDEIKCGDNDRISSLVADLIGADTLIILTNVDGVIGKDGNLIHEIEHVTDEIKALVNKQCGTLGTGGMHTKIMAADFAARSGIGCYIVNGRKKNILSDILSGRGKGTYFKPKVSNVTARKRWIGFSSKARGMITVDDGARTALVEKHKSLLSAGITAIKGDFKAGDIIGISTKNGTEIARGITNYSSKEIAKIKGVKTRDIEGILGYKDHDEVIHCDNLLVL